MTQFVQVRIIWALYLPMGAGRDDHLHALLPDALDDGICVIAAIGHEGVGLQALHEGQSLCAISDCTRRDSDSDR